MKTLFMLIAFFYANWLSIASGHAQQITSSVVVSGAGINDGFAHLGICDSQGQPYRQNPGKGRSVMRVARDGSTMTFTLPASTDTADVVTPEVVGVFAPAPPGLAVLKSSYSRTEGVFYRMLRFDAKGKVISEHRLSLEFKPTAMAISSSEKTIIVGYRAVAEERMRVGAVLDRDDQVLKTFDFPPGASTAEHNGFEQMAGGDGVSYYISGTAAGPIYSITESGVVNSIPVAVVNNTRHHKWMLGTGVAVEEYEFPSDEVPRALQFDVYDLGSGRKLSSKILPRPVGFATACYLGDEVSVWAHNGKTSSALSLVTAKLE